MAMVGVASGSLQGGLQADSQPGSFGLAEGRWPLGAIPYSLYELGELSKWLAMMTAP